MKRILLTLLLICSVLYSYGQTLLIYGGEDYKVYLGKLNASPYDTESVWNAFGTYGNTYSSNSIWNEYGKYGSEYSSYSPFNDFASYPPILIDRAGNFYGYFTSNKYKSQRCNAKWIDFICTNVKIIRKDVSDFYQSYLQGVF